MRPAGPVGRPDGCHRLRGEAVPHDRIAPGLRVAAGMLGPTARGMIPVSLVTGFLGSGKTTLIGHLLRQPGLGGTLVIVNEFGEVGIDHDLLEASSDDTILLANGCLCCTIRGNLVDTLLDLLAQRADGRLRAFERVVVETSGVVDPAPVLGFVFGDPRIAARYRPGAVIATCDAVAGGTVLERHPEAVSQAVLADRLLITKADIASSGAVAALRARLRALNPAAPIVIAVRGEGLDAHLLDAPAGITPRACPPGCSDPLHDHRRHDLHGGRFTARLLLAARPLARAEVEAIQAAIATHGSVPALLRLKGILALVDAPGSAILQAAPGGLHPLSFTAASTIRQGSLVLIGEGPPPPRLIEALARFGLASPAPPPAGHLPPR